MRTPTISVTDLVKQIAADEAAKTFAALRENLVEEIKTEIGREWFSVADRACEDIKNDLEQAGKRWTPEEDALLAEEVETAMRRIAVNHGRGKAGIRSRILQKDLLQSRG